MLKTKSGKSISKIGIGTWTIDSKKLDEELKVLQYYYDSGVNYIDVVLAYDGGATLDVVASFLKTIKREDIFINGFITYGCNDIKDIERQLDTYLNKLGIDYLDCLTLHSPIFIPFGFDNYIKEVQRLYKQKKFLNIGFSNLSPAQFSKVTPIANYFEGLYNLECKMNEDNGIINICEELKIPFFAYQPLRRNRTAKQNYKELQQLSKKYDKTQNQIIINWLTKHKGIHILIKSSNISHIKENLEALNFDMSKRDYLVLDKFRNKQFDNLPFSYTNEEGKVRIDQIPNQPIGII